MGGNTYVLRYEMRRSGFDVIIKDLLAAGIVYGGDSAGALVAGLSIAGVESADEPEFAAVMPVVRGSHQAKNDVIELTDTQAVIFEGGTHRIVEAEIE